MEYRDFVKTTLPYLGLRWRRFRSSNVKRRVMEQMRLAGFTGLAPYQHYLLTHLQEQRRLTGKLTVTISRFWRNRDLFGALRDKWLPTLLEQLPPGEPLRLWSAGCACGEEPYSLLMLWREHFRHCSRRVLIVASEIDERCLARARAGRYAPSSLRELPRELREKYFRFAQGSYILQEDLWQEISWKVHNLLWDDPLEGQHVIFCRNLVYTYFTDSLQLEMTGKFHRALLPGGLLVVGRKERLPAGSDSLFRQAAPAMIWERC
ncbi:MAG: hypothetical protein JRJ12_09615 [Deltaproteobacteria bacterium]|nr:hypothetical protein [Deltaproteobacteria bacterium]MBW2072665.1 hypothetical protein [Deltaproteobacteria bacterium]